MESILVEPIIVVILVIFQWKGYGKIYVILNDIFVDCMYK